MRMLIVSTAAALSTLLPFACASFGAAENADAGPPLDGREGGAEGGGDGTVDASADAATDAARTRIYVFGGATIVDQTEQPVFDAYAASILDDGSLGAWERAPALDVGRSHMTTIAAHGGPIIMAAGNGMPIGEGPSGNFTFFREDVAVAGSNPLDAWKGAPPLGAGNGRWAAPGTFALGSAYLGGGRVTGGGFTSTIMAARVTGTPPTVQPWQSAGALPFAMADYGLVALGSRLYVIGGSTARDGGVVRTSDTFMTTIAGDMVGGWTTAGKLPKPLDAFSSIVADGRVFVIGGDDGPASTSASVFIGTPNANQELVWQETTSLEHARRHLCVLGANGRFYAIGGAGVSAMTDVVEVGEVSGTGMTWRKTTPMPVTRSAFGCAVR